MDHITQQGAFNPDIASFVRVRNVVKSYGSSRILDNVSFSVQRSETKCIIGPSGSGKSTLLKCLNAMTTFDDGAIVIGKQRVGYTDTRGILKPWTGSQAARFRSRIGLVSQNVNLFSHRTVIENVIEGPVQVLGVSDANARRAASELLAQVGLSDKGNAYPNELSGGQQQRAAIARALSMKPELMLFDEATSALDPELVAEVLGVMRTLSSSGMTMIVVTHEMRFAAEVADTVVVMDNGGIVEDGAADQIFRAPRHPRTITFLSDRFQPQVTASAF